MTNAQPAPAVSVVIPVHNGATTLVAQLDAIAAGLDTAPTTEIVVVDNRSTDGSAAVAANWSERSDIAVRVVGAPDRAGEPHARNVGIEHARGDAIAFLDADDVARPTWLPAMADALRHHDYVTGPIDTHDLNEPWIADVRGSSVTDGRSTLYGVVPYAHGCNMGFRRSTLEAVGGFDESYLVGCDLDLAIRMWEAGHDLHYEPGASIAYRLRPSLQATFRQGVSYGRYRVRIQRRLVGRAPVGSPARDRLRRIFWMARHTAPSLWSKPMRARWVWVAGQVWGELRGVWELR